MKLFFYYRRQPKRKRKEKKIIISLQMQRKSFNFQPTKHLHTKDFTLKTSYIKASNNRNKSYYNYYN